MDAVFKIKQATKQGFIECEGGAASIVLFLHQQQEEVECKAEVKSHQR